MTRYNPAEIEPKWQKYWYDNKTFRCEAKSEKPKFYCLDMFPYPSGAGLHVGHPEGYTATDILCRYKRMAGFQVLHPMGWDAFGLPAEQHAVKTGTHPRQTTEKNINNFRRQIKALGFSYDWDREVNTTDPGYFKWTQWIFSKLFDSWYDTQQQKARPISELPIPEKIKEDPKLIKKYQDKNRLAYIDEVPVWWCSELGTVLANEEVIDGKSERGGHPCVRKPLRQWMLKITAYAERLLNDLNDLDWPEPIKLMQKNWIGRSEGALVQFEIQDPRLPLPVFTTRPDTLFGATYMVLAPEHPLVSQITTPVQKSEVESYVKQAESKSELERGMEKDKTGVFTGAYAINPVNDKPVPIWISDYVMMGYGTGAIMAVPAHDERDYEFARKFELPIIEVISGGNIQEKAHAGDGKLVNSGILDGLNVTDAKREIIAWLEEKQLGTKQIQYKLRDWLFSRQRYWGEPFPIVHTELGPELVPEEELPVTLPELQDYKPTGSFEPPLAKSTEWVKYENPKTGMKGQREVNTMPQWAGSCWYYLRYLDSGNDKQPWSKEIEKEWMPVDLYVGGAEHAVLHLLYSRFWHKVLFDLGYVSEAEPFKRLVNQGLILGEDGEKMSKSLGNVVNPDNVIADYGADAMRLYEMFMGPLERAKPWQMAGIEGQKRFLAKVWRQVRGEGDKPIPLSDDQPPKNLLKTCHRTIKKVTEDVEGLRFNTAISQLMILSNDVEKETQRYRYCAETLVQLLYPFAPHLCEELWNVLGNNQSISYHPWPKWDEQMIQEDQITLVLQVNGKVRSRVEVPKDLPREELEKLARADERMQKFIQGTEVKKVIAVPNRLVNFVVAPPKAG